MKLNALPRVALQTIFSKLSLQDVLQMSRVCLFWKSYQEAIASKVTSITLLVGREDPLSLITNSCFAVPLQDKLINDDGTPMYPAPPFDDKWFHVRYSSFNMETVQFLMETLPNIVTLNIAIYQLSYEVLDQVIYYVQELSSNLSTLKMRLKFREPDGDPLRNKVFLLFNLINAMPSLEHLIVELNHKLYPECSQVVNYEFMGIKPHFEMSILSRLRQFYFSTLDFIERTPLFYSLKQFVPTNTHLTHIGIGNWDKHLLFSWFAFLCPHVARRVTSLPVVDWDHEMALKVEPLQARRIFGQFPSITMVSFCHFAFYHTFPQLINSFSVLRHLVRLHLDLHLTDFRSNFKVRRPLPFLRDDHTPKSQIAQLSSVKILSLSVDVIHHSDLESCHWGWAFPNVQILKVKHKCLTPHTECSHYSRLKNHEFDQITQDQLLNGVREMLSTFKQCPKLRCIFTNEPVPTEWVVVEAREKKLILRVVKP